MATRFAHRSHSPAIRNFLPGSYERRELSRSEVLALRKLWKSQGRRGSFGKVSLGLPPPPDYFKKKRESIDARVQDFGHKVGEVPGFEELADKSNPRDIVCWSLILFVLIGLTGYSFVQLIVDYLDNPTVTTVSMKYSPTAELHTATLCIPFHLDRVPFGARKKDNDSSDDYYSWKAANELMEKLSAADNNSHLFSCPRSMMKPESVKQRRNVKVRLIDEHGKKNRNYGRVEIKTNNQWGTICDAEWGNLDAKVVCRTLGHARVRKAVKLHAIKSDPIPEMVWMDRVNCSGLEMNIGHCPHAGWGDASCVTVDDLAAVDCTGKANPNPWNGVSAIKLKKGGKRTNHTETKEHFDTANNYAIVRSAGALLARLSAVEMGKLVKGETRVSMKWSTSPTYPAGLLCKEMAIKKLLTLLDQQRVDLQILRLNLACRLCDANNMRIRFRNNGYSEREEINVFDCSEADLKWVEDSRDAHKACFKLHLRDYVQSNLRQEVRKGTFIVTVDLKDFYSSVDWSNETVRKMYSSGFKLDLSGSIDSEIETVETISLTPGKELSITVDVASNYKADDNDLCNEDFDNCELTCRAHLLHSSCSHFCTPFIVNSLLNKKERNSTNGYCLLDDYKKHCLRRLEKFSGINSGCKESCTQPCQHMTYSIRTLFKRPLLAEPSKMRLLIKLDSELYPEFEKESVITWYQLMGDLGGVIGLWLGASFVGVLHFIEFVIGDLILARRIKIVSRQLSVRGNDA